MATLTILMSDLPPHQIADGAGLATFLRTLEFEDIAAASCGALLPIGILPVLMSPFVGKYAHKFDLRLLAGLAFLAIGLIMLSSKDGLFDKAK